MLLKHGDLLLTNWSEFKSFIKIFYSYILCFSVPESCDEILNQIDIVCKAKEFTRGERVKKP